MVNTPQTLFDEACAALAALGHAHDAKTVEYMTAIMADFENKRAFESRTQRSEIYDAATCIILLDICKSSLWHGEPHDFDLSTGDAYLNMGRILEDLGATPEVIQAMRRLLDGPQFDLDALSDLSEKAWQRLTAIMDTPLNRAWTQARKHLEHSMEDPVVCANPHTVKFLERMHQLMMDAYAGTDSHDILKPIAAAARSANAAQAASEKNDDMKQWVLERWTTRADRTTSKKKFAETIAPQVSAEFSNKGRGDRSISPYTIEVRWLPKG